MADSNNAGDQQEVQPPVNEQAQATPPADAVPEAADASKKIPAGICGILLGSFGVHKFILGYTTEGIIMLAVSLAGGLVTCGAGTGIVGIIGLVEGIIYLTKTDEDFYNTYVKEKRAWF